MANNDAPFTLNVVGDVSTERYTGEFKAKLKLSHRDHLVRDKVRRELLGADSASAGARAQSIAEIVSQLTVRITKSPLWWQESSNGLELEDDNVLAKVYEETIKIENEYYEELKKKAEASKEELKTVAKEMAEDQAK